MSSKREDIMSAIATLLSTAAGVFGRVYRSRVEALRREETPSIIIEQMDDRAAIANLNTLDWVLQFRVLVVTRGDVPDSLADPIVNDVYAKLMADRSLGGLVMDIEPVTISFRMTEGDQASCTTELQFAVRHRTSVSSLEV